MPRTTPAFPIVVSGPSGVGKTTLIDRAQERDPLLSSSISATTRAPRDGEESGVDYFFVTPEIFEEMKDRELVEWAEVYGELYGTPKRYLDEELAKGSDVILNIDTQGGISVKKVFPEAFLILILPPSFKALEDRIRNRGFDRDIEKRLEAARQEILDAIEFGYDRFIVNDNLDHAVEVLVDSIDEERRRGEQETATK